MRLSFISASLAVSGTVVSAAALPAPPTFPALPVSAFSSTQNFTTPITLEEALKVAPPQNAPLRKINALAAAATCANPRVRVEWDNAAAADRTAYVSAIKCLLGKPASGAFSQAKNRYEDLVALHQSLTPNVHGNAKFLIWHRYYLFTFEDILRSECGFTGPLLWFDETKYAGRFAASSIFSNDYFGAVNVGGGCVTNGKFANLGLNVGPGSGNTPHCLSRNGNDGVTANGNTALFNACNQRTDYADMAVCLEGAHSYGHNGIGSVMQDTYASPGDPTFFLHHAFIDRQYRIWQNADGARVTYVDGVDRVGNPLTLSTSVSVNGLRPNVVISDIINTMAGKLCYKYNY